MCMYVCVHACTHAYRDVYVSMYVHMYMCLFICIHVCAHKSSLCGVSVNIHTLPMQVSTNLYCHLAKSAPL